MSNPEFSRMAKPSESEQDRALRRMADAVHTMNLAIARAVDSGLSVELVRGSRHHDGAGNWGDQMVPLVRVKETAAGLSEARAESEAA